MLLLLQPKLNSLLQKAAAAAASSAGGDSGHAGEDDAASVLQGRMPPPSFHGFGPLGTLGDVGDEVPFDVESAAAAAADLGGGVDASMFELDGFDCALALLAFFFIVYSSI